MGNFDSKIEEKRALRLVYATIILAFSIIALYSGSGIALLIGIFSALLTGYAHFIISKYYPDGDKYILVLSSFLAQIGLVMLYRIDPSLALRQITWFTLGMSIYILIVVLLPDIECIERFKYFFLCAAIGLLLMTQIFGEDIKGATSWINLGFTSIQPSEFAKVFIILYLASELKKYRERKDLILPALSIMVSLIFLVLEKDLGTALIFFVVSIVMVYIGTSKLHYVLVSVLMFMMGAVGSYFAFAHVRSRVEIWLDPWKTATGSGYQIVQSLYAIASGGFLGTGLYLGHPNYIPEVQTDFIFSVICEEFGLLGGFAIIIIYFLLIYRGFRTAIYANSTFSRMVAVGISTMIGSQVFIIIGGVIKLIPLTGITMPLVSYGGSSMLINFIALGILQKISEA